MESRGRERERRIMMMMKTVADPQRVFEREREREERIAGLHTNEQQQTVRQRER